MSFEQVPGCPFRNPNDCPFNKSNSVWHDKAGLCVKPNDPAALKVHQAFHAKMSIGLNEEGEFRPQPMRTAAPAAEVQPAKEAAPKPPKASKQQVQAKLEEALQTSEMRMQEQKVLLAETTELKTLVFELQESCEKLKAKQAEAHQAVQREQQARATLEQAQQAALAENARLRQSAADLTAVVEGLRARLVEAERAADGAAQAQKALAQENLKLQAEISRLHAELDKSSKQASQSQPQNQKAALPTRPPGGEESSLLTEINQLRAEFDRPLDQGSQQQHHSQKAAQSQPAETTSLQERCRQLESQLQESRRLLDEQTASSAKLKTEVDGKLKEALDAEKRVFAQRELEWQRERQASAEAIAGLQLQLDGSRHRALEFEASNRGTHAFHLHSQPCSPSGRSLFLQPSDFSAVPITLGYLMLVKCAFQVADVDGLGFLDVANLGQYCQQKGLKDITYGQLMQMIDAADPGRTGVIHFFSFLGIQVYMALSLKSRSVSLPDWIAFCNFGPGAFENGLCIADADGESTLPWRADSQQALYGGRRPSGRKRSLLAQHLLNAAAISESALPTQPA